MRKILTGLLIAILVRGLALAEIVYDRDGRPHDLDALQKQYNWSNDHKRYMANQYRNYYSGAGDKAVNTLDVYSDTQMQEDYANQEIFYRNGIFRDNYLDGKEGAARRRAIEQIDMFGRLYNSKYGFPTDRWFVLINKKSPEQKIAELRTFLESLINGTYARIRDVRINGEDVGFIRENINRINDDFDDKVAGLTPVVETREEILDNGIKIPVTITTYTDSSGKRYVREERRYPGSVEPHVMLRETNQPFFDYSYVREREDGNGFLVYSSRGSVTIGTRIPQGYSVARDRSEFLSDDDKGRLIIVPDNPTMLPLGVSVVDDGRGGKTLRAASPDVFRENGNLILPPDPTLERTTMVYYARQASIGSDYDNEWNWKTVGRIKSQASGFVINTQSGGNYWYGDSDSIFYSHSALNDMGNTTNHAEDRQGQTISYCNGKRWTMERDEQTGWWRIPDWVEKECGGR